MSFLRRLVADNAYVLLPFCTLCWAGNHVLGRAIAGHVPPGGLAVLRWLLALAILLPFAWPHLRRDAAAFKARPAATVFLALTGAAIFGTVQFVALQYAPAVNMSVLNSVAPVFILVASFVLFGDRLRVVQMLGVAISLVGVLTIISQGDPGRLAGMSFAAGDLLIVANMSLWAIYCACLRLRPNVHWLSFLAVLCGISALANMPYMALEYAHGLPLQATVMTMVAIAYVAIVNSVLGYAAWNRGVELIGAPRASAFLHLIPVFGAILASTILGERLQAFHVVAFVLILGGVTLAARQKRVA